ncbi:DNA-binding LacI/PurR family transcriptional regulator [Actinoplanes lutulentus]|uniref:LacI family transcriptional regulator n=1 Tax=Actinoplanes lutulentus TaxID=1287878 RepID=A0A327ZLH3_9ACTN|nr:LacI family DNA-binding transcriptional regulator [Actinoplanes lutulentus]MBB2940866.1 DNA-binding LacI/PurR family transcriptional regulator [Actinoplanes lutulentus]RAK43175.1 LacI family transcriptional regulator [Actinoplanes lutulentus]
MAATIKDVARLAGVSASSVCRALAKPEQVRPETRERVERAASDLGYYPNRAARGLITGRTANIGVVLPDLANPFFPSVVKAIQTQARRFDYAVFLSDTDEDPALEVPLIRALAKQVDGFLLCSPRAGDEELRAFAGHTPIVVLNRRVTPFPSVTADSADGMRQAIGHLHALGHRRVAYVAGPRTSWSNRDRLRGLRSATSTYDMELIEAGNVAPTVDGGAAVADLVAASPVTAVIAYNDLVALGLLNRFRAREIAVPERISVVGFDDILLAGLVTPALTTVAIAKEQIGRTGVDLFLDLLKDDEGRKPVHKRTPTQLIVRASTGPAHL